jgi:hypothetical protein
MLGGVEDDANYSIGSCPVYLDLVGQARGQQKVVLNPD